MKSEIEQFRRDAGVPKFNDEPIRGLLQESMPILHRNAVGRMRLIRALEFKFGKDYKTFEAPAKALKHFDDEVDHLRAYIRIKRKHSNG